MQDIIGESLKKLKNIRVRKIRMTAIVLVLSLIVSLDVFWWLKQPGLTLAGDADCRIVEHTHDDTCQNAAEPCTVSEHVHDISCYSDDTADAETQADWHKMFDGFPYTENLREDIVGIAKTQVGYTESAINFKVGDDGVRRGYTRYGAWYGTPYTDWSAVFVSFCLNYAGADPNDTPGNTGANSIAESWKRLNKYASVGEYDPVAGDLVFFDNNTVGIISDKQSATCYIIRGDVDGAVHSDVISLTDPSIKGWGVTDGTVYSNKDPTADEILDITNGPSFFIFEGSNTKQTTAQVFSLRKSRAILDLVEYLNTNEGSYFFTLLDNNNQELPKDESGNYVVQADTGYKLTISFTSPEGFIPGTYQYQTPDGLMVDGGEGTFVLKDGTNVGDWTVTDDGLITLNFNEHMNSRTEITISATLGIHFPEQETPIDFDGKITVTVQKPTVQKYPTKVNKWGAQGNEQNANKSDPTKLYWSVQIIGDKDSQIPGSTITDKTISGQWSKTHKFTASDIAGGLTFGVSEPDPVTGGEKAWHSWHVSPDDPNLVWTETEWTYKIPESATCQWCGEVILGNEGWNYTMV